MAFYYGIHNVAQYSMSAFRGKADMPFALQMSAFDPKRTSCVRIRDAEFVIDQGFSHCPSVK